MAKFDKAIETVLKHEGGYVDDPSDKGGATKYGISLAYLKQNNIDINLDGKVTKDDVLVLTLDEAKKLYRDHFWMFDAVKDQNVATKLFDMSVNMGVRQAVVLAQRALNGIGCSLVEDGDFGSKTTEAVNSKEAWKVLAGLRDFAIAFYYHVAEVNPKNVKFIDGWIKRASWMGA
jgi:lysozyme family protein